MFISRGSIFVKGKKNEQTGTKNIYEPQKHF